MAVDPLLSSCLLRIAFDCQSYEVLAGSLAAGLSRGQAVPHSPELARTATSWSWHSGTAEGLARIKVAQALNPASQWNHVISANGRPVSRRDPLVRGQQRRGCAGP